VTSRYPLYRLFRALLLSLGRGIRAFSLPAFFSRLFGNGAELRREAETWKGLYEEEHRERLKLQDRLLQRQGVVPLETPLAQANSSPPVQLPQVDFGNRDIFISNEEEAMMAASDPERLALLRDAADVDPEWKSTYQRAMDIVNESAQPQYGGMQ